MQAPTNTSSIQEIIIRPQSGWPVLVACLVGAVVFIALFVTSPAWVPFGVIGTLALFLTTKGFYIVNPNLAKVLVLFGKYKGTVDEDGFFWTNPFMVKRSISLRAHNHDGGVIKVNDLLGNPIEISAVVVWRVHDTARASFDVEDYSHYVQVQSEAALRSMATTHPYDDLDAEGAQITLRGSQDEVSEELKRQLEERLSAAGVEVMEARLSHLAYASEIASAMLQRQQAKAIIAARRQIVEGAVGMVELALEMLKHKNIVQLEGDKRAELVSNLLIVLCGQANPQPVLPMGGGLN